MIRTIDMRAKSTQASFYSILWMIGCLSGCISLSPKQKDLYFESFYEKTRLIMRDEEKEIYRSLPDTASRKEFIEQFWKIRDPDPTTEENEHKIEFENRIAFANEWFGNWKTFAGKSMGRGQEKDRGWKTSRGRVYIILGPPSMVSYEMGWGPMKLYNDNKNNFETWYYPRYDLTVSFSKRMPYFWRADHAGDKDKGEPYLRDWDYDLHGSTDLLYAFEDAKLNMIHSDYRGDFIRAVSVKATYRNDCFILKIPIERVTFEEREERLHALYHLKIRVYKDNKVVDEVEETKTCSFLEEEVLDRDDIVLEIPYKIPEKGNYMFDLILTDLESIYGAKHRTIIKKNLSRTNYRFF